VHLSRSYGDGFILLPARADGKKMRVPVKIPRAMFSSNLDFLSQAATDYAPSASFKSLCSKAEAIRSISLLVIPGSREHGLGMTG